MRARVLPAFLAALRWASSRPPAGPGRPTARPTPTAAAERHHGAGSPTRLPPRGLSIVLALVLPSCALGRPPRYEVPSGPRKLDEATPQERLEYVRRAQVWRPTPIATLDLRAGPPGDDAFSFEEAVTCDYAPDIEPGGATPKFYCTVAPGDDVKVKFGEDNGEVYAEVSATRLFWALGFGADRQYPARVTCRGCSADPWRDRAPHPAAEHTFDPAIIERPPAGTTIKVKKAEKGWAWWELLRIDERVGGAPRAHVDALRLLAAFVQHGDNKDEQQRLVCLPGGVERDAAGSQTCTRPFLVVTDVGATFSRAGLRNTNKFELHKWASVPVWQDRERCVAKLTRSFTGSFGNPRISEEGRAFLARLLVQLSDRQIHDLFSAARAERRGERIEGADGRERPVTADDWAETFRRKRAEIVAHRCPR
ncbi:MAG TPA: hypothetical protein VMT87_11660 [Vicinamibacteria bacterium]|nr:hypothetical protein [Vicinamibacteria bacterium]